MVHVGWWIAYCITALVAIGVNVSLLAWLFDCLGDFVDTCLPLSFPDFLVFGVFVVASIVCIGVVGAMFIGTLLLFMVIAPS